MITNNKIKEIIEQMSENGFAIGVRDISYILLCKSYEDDIVAYKSLFGDGSETEISYYKQSKTIVELGKLMAESLGWNTKEDITFEENKAYMLKLKADTERAMEDGKLETKDGLKILSDISTRLNDKFNVQDKEVQQTVMVQCKYNSCCECGREIYIPTKEDLMKQYGLIERKKLLT